DVTVLRRSREIHHADAKWGAADYIWRWHTKSGFYVCGQRSRGKSARCPGASRQGRRSRLQRCHWHPCRSESNVLRVKSADSLFRERETRSGTGWRYQAFSRGYFPRRESLRLSPEGEF